MAIVENENFSSHVPESGEPLSGPLFDTPLTEARGWLLDADEEVTLLPGEDNGVPGVLVIGSNGASFRTEVELDGASLPGGYVEPASKAVGIRSGASGEQAVALIIKSREFEDEAEQPLTLQFPKNELEASYLALRLASCTRKSGKQSE